MNSYREPLHLQKGVIYSVPCPPKRTTEFITYQGDNERSKSDVSSSTQINLFSKYLQCQLDEKKFGILVPPIEYPSYHDSELSFNKEIPVDESKSVYYSEKK